MGSDVALFGLGISVVGAGTAAVSAAAVQPAGVLAGGALVGDGAVISGFGSSLVTIGAVVSVMSGAGKDATIDLTTRALTHRIPDGIGKEAASEALSQITVTLHYITARCASRF